MTLWDALREADDSKPNALDRGQKIAWIAEVDGRIYHDMILTHERGEDAPNACPRYSIDTPDDTVLLCPDPYSTMYKWYLHGQIDLANMETDKYQNSMAAFNVAWGDFARKYHRDHMPIQQARKLIY